MMFSILTGASLWMWMVLLTAPVWRWGVEPARRREEWLPRLFLAAGVITLAAFAVPVVDSIARNTTLALQPRPLLWAGAVVMIVFAGAVGRAQRWRLTRTTSHARSSAWLAWSLLAAGPVACLSSIDLSRTVTTGEEATMLMAFAVAALPLAPVFAMLFAAAIGAQTALMAINAALIAAGWPARQIASAMRWTLGPR